MKAKDVLKVLRVSRPTLTKYVKTGLLKVIELPNGQYDYNEESVYSILNKDVERKTAIYARVSTSKQKNDLQNQISIVSSFCLQNGWKVHAVYQDVASGISFKKRNDFFFMLDEILDGKIKRIVISYRDRLSRVGFELFYHLFKRFGTEIVVMSEVGNSKLDSQEIFEEIVSLLHCYSMKLYSNRRKNLVERLIKPEDRDDSSES